MNSFNINSVPIEITKFYSELPCLRVDLGVGEYKAAIIEPKRSLLSDGLVYLCGIDGTHWDQIIEYGITNDQRIVEITTKLVKGKLSERDVGTVYPPLE
jgi:hypothetical protein